MSTAPLTLPVRWARTLTVLGALIAVVSLHGVLIDRYVLDTDRYTAAVAPLIDEPEVQQRLADRLTGAVMARLDRLAFLDDAVAPVIREAVATERFADAWEDAVRFSHDEFVGALRGESGSLSFDETTLYADVGSLAESLETWLVEQGIPQAERIPAVEGRIVLVDMPQLPRTQAVLSFADRAALFLGAGAVLLLVGVLVSPVRRHGVLLGAAVVAVSSATVLATDLVVRSEYLADLSGAVLSAESAQLVYDALTSPIRTALLWTALVALAVTVTAAVWPRSRTLPTGRSTTAAQGPG
jgi:hypothetical protein